MTHSLNDDDDKDTWKTFIRFKSGQLNLNKVSDQTISNRAHLDISGHQANRDRIPINIKNKHPLDPDQTEIYCADLDITGHQFKQKQGTNQI